MRTDMKLHMVRNRVLVALITAGIYWFVPSTSFAQSVAEIQAEQLVVRAMTKSFLGYHEEAIAIYKKAQELAPSSPVISSAIADEYQALDDLGMAVYYAMQAKEYAPDNPLYFHQLAQLYVDQNDYEAAERVYGDILFRFPGNIDALEELAYLQYTSDRFEEARESYEKLEERLGPQQHISYRLLQIHYELNDVDGMEQALLNLQSLNPANTSIKRNLAELYAQSNRMNEAVQLLEEALVEDSTDVEVVVSLAKLYEAAGDAAKAESHWSRAMQATGSPEDAFSRATHLYARADEHPETLDVVVKLLEYAVDADPSYTEALILLGNIRFEEQRYESAGELLYRAVQTNPRNPEVWLQAAAAYLEIDQPRQAADIADEALLLFPGQTSLMRVAAYGYMDAYQNDRAIRHFVAFHSILEEDKSQEWEQAEILSALGLLYARKKDYAASDDAYRRSLAISPENATVLNNLAYSYAEREVSLDQALQHAQKAVSLDNNNYSYMDTLGWIYFKRGNFREAEKWITNAMTAGGETAVIYEHLGEIKASLGKEKEALEAWKKSLELNPNNESLAEKVKLIHE